jgi:cytidylate kinase
MEGRDIGSVVFPQAALKLYLLAPSSTRARRRLIERAGGEGGVAAGPRSVAEALQARDRRDERVNPPVPPPGAVVIDTNDKDAEAVFREALALARRALEASR